MRTAPHTLWNHGPCFWCGRTTYRMGPDQSENPALYTRDHLIPKRLRRVSLQNVPGKLAHRLTVTCCRDCNRTRGQKNAWSFARLMKVLQDPEKKRVIDMAYDLNSRS